IASILANIAQMYLYQNNYELALKTYQKSLALAEELGTKDLLSEGLSNIGDFYHSQGDFDKALEFSQRALTVGKQIGSPERTWHASTVAGKAYRALNRLDQARQAFEEAIAAIETIRGQLAGNEQQQEQFFENKLSPYHGMVELLIAQNKKSEAL